MRKIILNLLVSIGCIALLSLNAQAAIYKCVSAKKKVYYIDQPCPKKDQETKFKAVKDPKNGYKPQAFVEDNVEKAKNDGIVVGGESSNNSIKQDHDASKSVNQKNGGGGSSDSSGAKESGARKSSVSQSLGTKGSADGKEQISSNNSSHNPEYDGREPANVDDLIPATEEAAQKLN